MSTVPQSYHDFIYYYSPWLYVITTTMTSDAAASQKNVAVVDGTLFSANMPVQIYDSVHSEWNEVDSVALNVVTMKNNLANTYYTAKGGTVDHPEIAYGKAAFAAAFAIEYLCEAYNQGQFSATKAAILAKIIEQADWLLTQQCLNAALKAYGGFKSSDTSTAYYSVDAGRAIPALLKAYDLTADADYLAAAILAGYTFLYNMQHQPELLSLVDGYYGGLAMYVTDADVYSTVMMIEDLYDLLGLKMLADTYDHSNAARYNTMMEDMVGFYVDGLLEMYLYYQPPPYGLGTWYRVGLNDEQVYDDVIAYALVGLYAYEGWSARCQQIYETIQSIRQSGTYPAYQPCVCWPGYINIVTRTPDCAYYDAVTIGILSEIRRDHDKPSYVLAHDIVEKYSDAFLSWGVVYADFSPIAAQEAMAAIAWIARMFLNYSYPMTDFSGILEAEGEQVLLYSVCQAVETVTYLPALAMRAVVKNANIGETFMEAGYVITDYLTIYSLLPTRERDKIKRRGVDYEVQTVQKVIDRNEPLYYKAQVRRLQAN